MMAGITGARIGRRTPLRRVMLYSFASLVFGFLVLPTFVVVPLSVTDSPYLHFPPEGFTWQWYQDYFGLGGASHAGTAGRWVSATLVSLELALLVVVAAVPVGALAAYGLSRGVYRGKSVLNAIILSPLVMPVLVSAIALFFFLSKSLRAFFQPLPLPSVPVWGEWVIVVLVSLLAGTSLLALLLPRLVGAANGPRPAELFTSGSAHGRPGCWPPPSPSSSLRGRRGRRTVCRGDCSARRIPYPRFRWFRRACWFPILCSRYRTW